ncbi:hypothetical protein [Gordonia sp. (in: high G+C Gram-positive bacteria)]|uniref:hypothetical protein n=1 Tax=Gordonia sp. (in: high G+C Gram-positive bacteria) TaxID=84139 RepID=UPI0039E57F2C
MSHDETTNVPATADPAVPAPGEEHQHAPKHEGTSFGHAVSSALKRALLALIGVAVLIVLFFFLRSVVPREWADFVQDIVQKKPDEKPGVVRGTSYGIGFGIVFTLVPVVCLAMAVASWDRLKHFFGVLFLLAGIITALPNLLTLAINSSHPTEIGSPQAEAKVTLTGVTGFQSGTLIGAIIGGVIALVIVFFIIKYKIRGRKLEAQKAKSASSDD